MCRSWTQIERGTYSNVVNDARFDDKRTVKLTKL